MPRNAKAFTDYAIKTLKPSQGQKGWRELADGGCRGLILRLSPRGEKVWAVRTTIGGKRKHHTFAGYPETSLADARTRASEYLSAAREGLNGGDVDARSWAVNLTVKDAHGEYLTALKDSLRVSTYKLKDGMFAAHIEPIIGSRMVRTVRKSDVTEVVQSVAAKGYATQANRVFAEIKALLTWCEIKGYIDAVPTIRKKDMQGVGAAKERPRSRTLSDAEVKEVWEKSAGLGRRSRDFLRLLLLTGQRRDEVRLMTWQEIDMAQGLWVIPASRYKTGIDQAVPLSEPVLKILRKRWTEGATGPVLSGRIDGSPFNGATSAMRRLRAAMPERAPFTLHDLRRTVRTGLSRLGVTGEVAELVLGHVPQGIQRVYNLHDHLEEKRDALKRWGKYVNALRRVEKSEGPDGNKQTKPSPATSG